MQVMRRLQHDARQNHPVSLTVTHVETSKQVKVTIVPVFKCAYGFKIDERNKALNADANGWLIRVSPSMMNMMQGDDELAGVVGHELAHNLFEHPQRGVISTLLSKIISSMVNLGGALGGVHTAGGNVGANINDAVFEQAYEREADYVGAYLAARAGFDPEGAITAMQKMAYDAPETLRDGSSHPATAERIWNLQQTVAEIHDKQNRGALLLPNLNDDVTLPNE